TVVVPHIDEPPKPDHAKAKREFQEVKVKYGNDWPTVKLTEIATQIQDTPVAGANSWGGGGRHHALFCGALSVSGMIDKGYLPIDLSRRVLVAAGKSAGISPAEVERTIENAFRQGGVR
ncbi:MAG: hypothetical protein OEU92_24430, partial [Alphaproteobacteria bacterium]|nr:hypothetical protein [Alphaproteobacteria bacterium]